MYLATYGTLRVNQPNWMGSLSQCPHIGTFRLEGFQLYTSGFIPYAFEEEGSIVVDVFDIDEEELQRCDMLEGYPNHYNRKLVRISDEVVAWIYYIVNSSEKRACRRVADGDWVEDSAADFPLRRRDDPPWWSIDS